MSLQMSAVMLGVEDLDRAKRFYVNGLGCEVDQDYPGFVRCRMGSGSTMLALYEWEAAAQDAGVPPEGAGFRGVSLHHLTDSRNDVDETMQAAESAGGTVVKEPAATEWGGYFGYFSDPDGHLWKVATAV
ncbi:VOC family protein [Streptomyces sp. Je 1-369]|uniref:VOC family protein n=1 Tax=Streptomyces sp. Je 1-369 TaxID=2966192 RepID=UPI002285F785|nr:VOC family protein [Streptomyces sp. Je 1-369]WAL98948.1 VOC family protein [Streptomyces sp. Je 1-369]